MTYLINPIVIDRKSTRPKPRRIDIIVLPSEADLPLPARNQSPTFPPRPKRRPNYTKKIMNDPFIMKA